MPIYEYQCKECGAISEYLTGMGNDENISCKECKSTEMERIWEKKVQRMAAEPLPIKLRKEFILKGGTKYENCCKFQWNKFGFTD